MLYKLINKYYEFYINAEQELFLMFLHEMELLSNKAYSKKLD
jgi:hypothetical protein